jgi:hypothetical protein
MLFSIYVALNVLFTIVTIASLVAGLYIYGLEHFAKMERFSTQMGRLVRQEKPVLVYSLQVAAWVLFPLATAIGVACRTALIVYANHLDPQGIEG